MNPYDRRAVRSVWSRVMPGRDVFAPGPWPAPPASGRGGLPPTPPRNPNDNRPPMPPPWRPEPGGRPRPNPPGPGGWPPPPPPPPPQPSAISRLLELAAGYDTLAMRRRLAGFRQMAAQCRRGAGALRSRCGTQGTYDGPGDTTLQTQREREAALRSALELLPPNCAQLAQQLSRESQTRSRQLARMR